MQLDQETIDALPESVVKTGQQRPLSAYQLRLILAGFRWPSRRRSLRSTAILALCSVSELELVRCDILKRKWRPGVVLVGYILLTLGLLLFGHLKPVQLIAPIWFMISAVLLSITANANIKTLIVQQLDQLKQEIGTIDQLESQLPALDLTSGEMYRRAVERISVLMDTLSSGDYRKVNANSRGYLLEFLSKSIRRAECDDAPGLKLEEAVIRFVTLAPDLRFEPYIHKIAAGKSALREQSMRDAAAIALESLMEARQRAQISDQLLRPGAQPADGTVLLRAAEDGSTQTDELLRAAEPNAADILENRT
jgi:hypothetical protein